jgi:23S rRNA (uracil1939-C5)-methyltransferase
VSARCAHFGVCGGCALQHLDPRAQIEAKQDTLLQNLERIGKVSPLEVLEPLTGPQWNYRRKARLSVRYVSKKERLLIGFRERQGRFVAEMNECHVLDQRVAGLLPQLVALICSLDARDRLPQIEVACGDRQCALVMRHMDPLSQPDVAALTAFAREHGVAVLLQPGGPDTVNTLEPRELKLDFALPEYGLVLEFGPSDFIQVNADLNRKMIHHALELMQPEQSDNILDLFCGLGNFTLPLARRAGRVTGVEGDASLVEKAWANAARNVLENVKFHVADLAADVAGAPWLKQGYDKILIDPPRSGAEEMLAPLAATTAYRLVYVSCHPASLARDAGILVQQHGFTLKAAGVMDMFPHTAHVESIALFERKR